MNEGFACIGLGIIIIGLLLCPIVGNDFPLVVAVMLIGFIVAVLAIYVGIKMIIEEIIK